MHHSISECCCFIGVNEHAGAVPTVNCFVVVYVVDYDVVVFSVDKAGESNDVA
jgi:hypothetical protein